MLHLAMWFLLIYCPLAILYIWVLAWVRQKVCESACHKTCYMCPAVNPGSLLLHNNSTCHKPATSVWHVHLQALMHRTHSINQKFGWRWPLIAPTLDYLNVMLLFQLMCHDYNWLINADLDVVSCIIYSSYVVQWKLCELVRYCGVNCLIMRQTIASVW